MGQIFEKDVHELSPIVPISISRVGIVNFKRPIKLEKEGNIIEIIATISIYIDIPPNKKGAHMSRNIEAIEEVLENGSIVNSWKCPSELAVELARKLAIKHPYANRIEVEVNAQFPLEKYSPVKRVKSIDVINVIAGAKAFRRNEKLFIRKLIGVEMVGMTVCPNSLEMTKEYAKKRLLEIGLDEEKIEEILRVIPLSAHNQRGLSRIILDIPEEYFVDFLELIEIVEKSVSSPVYPILKREDEQFMVINAHQNPRFTEDVVRVMVGELVKRFNGSLPDNTYIIVSQENFESIHSHNVYSEISGSLGELKAKIL